VDEEIGEVTLLEEEVVALWEAFEVLVVS